MDMFDGVGRRRNETEGTMFTLGSNSLNGNERDCLYRNNGDGTFTDVAYVNNADRVEDGRGVVVFDYDQDGRVDVALRNYKQPAVLLHNVGGDAHWLELKLIGTRSNRDAIGARVTLRSDGLQQVREVHAGSGYQSGSSLIQHFGLGPATTVDEIHIRWPSGSESTLTDVAADQLLVVQE
jgi:choline dehydrogenase-like flavoprotein